MNLPSVFRSALLQMLWVFPVIAAPPHPWQEKAIRFHDPSTPIKQGKTWWIFSTGNGIVIRSNPDDPYNAIDPQLFADWGLCCRGVNSTYELRIGRSRKITGPYLDASDNDMATGGGTLFLKSEGDRISPGHPSFIEENGNTRMFFHYYDGKRFGFATLGDLSIRWNKVGWPE